MHNGPTVDSVNLNATIVYISCYQVDSFWWMILRIHVWYFISKEDFNLYSQKRE